MILTKLNVILFSRTPSGVSPVYSALSWDRLHAYHGGLFSDHILVELRSALKDLGGRSEAIVDAG